MHAIVRRAFARLRLLNPDEEEAKLVNTDTDSADNELRMNVQTTEETPPADMTEPVEPPSGGELEKDGDTPEEKPDEVPPEDLDASAGQLGVRSDCE